MSSAAPVERLYDSNRIFALELSAPFRAVFSERGEERTYRPASLRFRDQAGVEHDVSVEIRIRGNYRARPSICAFPMLRLRVSKKGGRGTVFEGQKRLRLVTHCGASGDYEQSLLLEYLAYRMYTVLSDASVRTRLVAIRYVDTTRPDARPVTRFGFFVEDVRDVARRLGTRRHKESPGDRADHDSGVLNRLEVYQYMLGNTDWSPVGSEPGALLSQRLSAESNADRPHPLRLRHVGVCQCPLCHAEPQARNPERPAANLPGGVHYQRRARRNRGLLSLGAGPDPRPAAGSTGSAPVAACASPLLPGWLLRDARRSSSCRAPTIAPLPSRLRRK